MPTDPTPPAPAPLTAEQANAPLVVCDGKYTFQKNADGWQIDVLRYGEKWLTIAAGHNAVSALMFELAEARVTLDAARAELAVAKEDLVNLFNAERDAARAALERVERRAEQELLRASTNALDLKAERTAHGQTKALLKVYQDAVELAGTDKDDADTAGRALVAALKECERWSWAQDNHLLNEQALDNIHEVARSAREGAPDHWRTGEEPE